MDTTTNSKTTSTSTPDIEVPATAKTSKQSNILIKIKKCINRIGEKKQDIWNKNGQNISDIIIQLLPIWILILYTIVFDYSFDIDEYTGTLYMYVIIQNASDVSAPLDNIKEKRLTTNRAMCVLLICMSTIMYGMQIIKKIILIDQSMDNGFKNLIVCLVFLGLTVRRKLIINNIEGDKQNG